jgi:hypothetical protein
VYVCVCMYVCVCERERGPLGTLPTLFPLIPSTHSIPLPLSHSVCEEAWASERLGEHSELCAVLRQVGKGMSVDAHLTTLANVIEEQAGPGFDSRVPPFVLRVGCVLYVEGCCGRSARA